MKSYVRQCYSNYDIRRKRIALPRSEVFCDLTEIRPFTRTLKRNSNRSLLSSVSNNDFLMSEADYCPSSTDYSIILNNDTVKRTPSPILLKYCEQLLDSYSLLVRPVFLENEALLSPDDVELLTQIIESNERYKCLRDEHALLLKEILNLNISKVPDREDDALSTEEEIEFSLKSEANLLGTFITKDITDNKELEMSWRIVGEIFKHSEKPKEAETTADLISEAKEISKEYTAKDFEICDSANFFVDTPSESSLIFNPDEEQFEDEEVIESITTIGRIQIIQENIETITALSAVDKLELVKGTLVTVAPTVQPIIPALAPVISTLALPDVKPVVTKPMIATDFSFKKNLYNNLYTAPEYLESENKLLEEINARLAAVPSLPMRLSVRNIPRYDIRRRRLEYYALIIDHTQSKASIYERYALTAFSEEYEIKLLTFEELLEAEHFYQINGNTNAVEQQSLSMAEITANPEKLLDLLRPPKVTTIPENLLSKIRTSYDEEKYKSLFEDQSHFELDLYSTQSFPGFDADEHERLFSTRSQESEVNLNKDISDDIPELTRSWSDENLNSNTIGILFDKEFYDPLYTSRSQASDKDKMIFQQDDEKDDSKQSGWFFNWFDSARSTTRQTTTTNTTTTLAPPSFLTIIDPVKNAPNWFGMLAQHLVNSTSNQKSTALPNFEEDIPRKISYNRHQIWRLNLRDQRAVIAMGDYKNSAEGAKLQWLKGPSLRGPTDVLIPPKLTFMLGNESLRALQDTRTIPPKQSSSSRSSAKESPEAVPGSSKQRRSVEDNIASKRPRMDVSAVHNEKLRFAKSVVGREGTPRFNNFLDFLIKGEGGRCLEVLKREGVKLTSVSSILGKAGANATKAFKDLYDLWFDKQGNKTQYLKTLKENEVSLSNISSILGKAGANAAKAFKDLYDLLFDAKGNKTQYLKTLKENGVNLSNISSILNGAGANAAQAFKNLYGLWFDAKGNKTQYLKTLEENGVNLSSISSILSGAGANAAQAFKNLYGLWFDAKGNKTQYLKTLEENGVNLSSISSILSGAGANSIKAFKDLYDLLFDAKGNKTQYLKALEENGVSLSNISSILSGAGANATKAFKDLYDLWFYAKGNKTQYLKNLEENGVNLANMSSILSRAGANAAKAFKDLYDLWFDAKGNKTQYLKTLKKEEINLSNISSILHGVGANSAKTFKDLYDLWFDTKGNKTQYLKTLEENGVNLANISCILNGVGANATKAFKNLYDLWFDAKGNKTQYLKTLEENGVNLSNISSILSRAGANSVKAFKGLYNLWFDTGGNKAQCLKTLEKNGIDIADISGILSGAGANATKAFKDLCGLWFNEEGSKTQYLKTLEKEGINLARISSILHGAGANVPQAFKDLYNLWFDAKGDKTQHLKHFLGNKGVRRGFTLCNLSSILSKSGAKAKDASEELHNTCFNDKGEITELLDDFYKVGFKPSNLSSALFGTGSCASSVLKRLHSVCFNEKRETTKLLDNFYKVGFKPGNLCSMLSGSPDNLEKFHDFCFTEETKKYLNHFLNEEEGFKLSNLSKMLHGAGDNIFSAFKDFHDISFDEEGSKTQLLGDFHNAGFTPGDLSKILSMAGKNANYILRNFHKACFNKENYLNHFLAEKELFTPKDLSSILHGVGINVYPTFKKLHNLCFNKKGKKTEYLNSLSKNDHHNICDILREQIKKAPTFLDGTSLQQ